jgi:hypothetical protein
MLQLSEVTRIAEEELQESEHWKDSRIVQITQLEYPTDCYKIYFICPASSLEHKTHMIGILIEPDVEDAYINGWEDWFRIRIRQNLDREFLPIAM